MRVVLASVLLLAAFTLTALADTCPNCGGDLTDQGRCPYCQPKPEGAGT